MRPVAGLHRAWGALALLGVAASAGLWVGCDDGDPIYGVAGGGGPSVPGDTVLAIVLGDGQNGRTSEAMSEPLVVQATVNLGLDAGVPLTQNIQPVEGLEIDWSITSGVATLSTARSVTDTSGLASVTVTPGPLLGDIEVTATAVAENGVAVQFSLRTTVYLIDILLDRFEVPLTGDSIEVVVGDTIEWVNRDALRHAVLATTVPPGGFEFSSSDLANSQRYRFVPKVEGVFRYEDPLNVNPVQPTGVISAVGREVGGLRIVTSTSGQNPDHAYVVTIDGTRSSAIGADDEVTFPALSATAHAVRLLEVEANCSVAGENPRPVTVIAADTVNTNFEVTCE